MSMSIQSDVEILSVQAVEYYAQKHHLSEGDVFDLFAIIKSTTRYLSIRPLPWST